MNSDASTQPRWPALLPFGLFLAVFLGSGLYFQSVGTGFAFYQVAAPVAALPAIVLSILLSRRNLSDTVERFLRGAGNSNIMAMCMIYLLAGGFSAVAKASGGIDAVVAAALSVIPSSFLLPGLFIVGALISTAMGTSMGTIAALAPIALGVAGEAGLSLTLTAGTVTGGAMFGDNLSIISDTTIAATRTQGCEMKDKFRVNVMVAVPAAVITVLFLLFFSRGGTAVEAREGSLLAALPYGAILIMAVSGINVFVVLLSGIIFAGVAGFFAVPDFTLLTLAREIYGGFTGMQEIFILSLFIGGLGELMKEQGGLQALENLIARGIRRIASGSRKTAVAEAGIGILVFLTNLCTANNTVAILVTGEVARNIAETNGVEPKRSAGIMDIASCTCQGLIPWGAQILLAASIFEISPLAVVSHVHYCMILLPVTVAALIITSRKVKKPAAAAV